MKLKQLLASGLLLWLNAVTASATLVNNGNGLIYDTALNVTWTQDANLLGVLEANAIAKTGNDNSLITDIINANGGVVYDYNYGGHYDPYYHLSATDFSSNGMVDWWAAKAFAVYLNTQHYGGSNQWELPYTNQVWASNQTGSYLGELFYNELGGTTGNSMPSGPFSHIPTDGFYYLPAGDSTTFSAWVFDPRNGNQRITTSLNYNYAWAVSPGNVSAVPVPSAIWLFTSVLAGFIGFNRRKSNQQTS